MRSKALKTCHIFWYVYILFLYFNIRKKTPLSSTHEVKHHPALFVVAFQVGIGHL